MDYLGFLCLRSASVAVKINVINTSKSDEKPTRPAFELNAVYVSIT